MRCFDNMAKLIRSKRTYHPEKYSQNQLSAALGYKNGQFISNVERGLCTIPLKTLAKVSEVLNVSQEHLSKAMLRDHEKTIDNFFKSKDQV